MTHPVPQGDTGALRRHGIDLETAQRAADPLARLRAITAILTALATATEPDHRYASAARRHLVVTR